MRYFRAEEFEMAELAENFDDTIAPFVQDIMAQALATPRSVVDGIQGFYREDMIRDIIVFVEFTIRLVMAWPDLSSAEKAEKVQLFQSEYNAAIRSLQDYWSIPTACSLSSPEYVRP